MKLKNILVPFVTIFSLNCLYSTQTSSEAEAQEADLSCLFEKETPLQFSSQNLKSFFKRHALPTIALRGHSDENTLKMRHFDHAFTNYIKEVYNNRGYSTILSQDGTHIVEFLELSNELNLDTTTVYVYLRLFYNKIKTCELIDDTVVLQVLHTLPGLLERHFVNNDQQPRYDVDFLKKTIENMMFTRLTDNFADLQQDPDLFLSSLSTDIAQAAKQEFDRLEEEVNKHKESHEIRERLRQLIVKFFELALSRTFWNIKTHEGIWGSFIAIGNGLQLLGAHQIIDHMDDLDDLLWSLIHRFSFFLDFTGSSLPLEFYDEVETDIENNLVFFVETQEQDEAIKTKKETLADALLHAKTKAIAFNRGLIAHPL